MEYSPSKLRKNVTISDADKEKSPNARPRWSSDADKEKSANHRPSKLQRSPSGILDEQVKEVFRRFDKNGDGFLDYGELARAMKSLSGTTDETVLKGYFEMDTNHNKLVSVKEFIDYALHGPEAARFRRQLEIQTGAAREAQLREVFDRYDASCDGFLEIDELETVLRSLGAFTHHEVLAVCKDLDKSGDGEISFDEWIDWMRKGTGSQVVTKAKAILAPSDDDGLESVFYMFCSAGRSDMDAQSFIRMCRDANLLDKKFTDVSLDLIFNSCKRRGEKRMVFERFEATLKTVAETKGVPVADVRNALLQVCGPRLLGTKAVGPRISSAESPVSVSRTGSGASRRISGSGEKRRASSCGFVSENRTSSPGDKGTSQEKEKNFSIPPVDNRHLWKAFGIDLPAGRKLKTLYGGGKLDTVAKTKKPTHSSLYDEEAFEVVNGLQSGCAGLQFRRSTNIFDICRGAGEFVAWGEIVRGIRVDACWLKVGDKYLPVEVNKVRFLRRKHLPPSPKMHSGSQSMPDLSQHRKEGNAMWGRSLDFVLLGKAPPQQELLDALE